MKNAFSLFKRGVYGTFHQVSTKHLARYCDNRRKEQPEMFAQTVKELVDGEKLTYSDLTSEKISES